MSESQNQNEVIKSALEYPETLEKFMDFMASMLAEFQENLLKKVEETIQKTVEETLLSYLSESDDGGDDDGDDDSNDDDDDDDEDDSDDDENDNEDDDDTNDGDDELNYDNAIVDKLKQELSRLIGNEHLQQFPKTQRKIENTISTIDLFLNEEEDSETMFKSILDSVNDVVGRLTRINTMAFSNSIRILQELLNQATD